MSKDGKQIDRSGLYHEVKAENIDEGRMVDRLNAQIARAASTIQKQWAEVGERKGKATVTLKIEIGANDKMQEFVDTDYTISTSVTPVQHSTLVRAANGRLLVQPDGSSDENPDQLRMTDLYDQRGNLRAKVDPRTGEVADAQDEGVAGKVGGSSA